MGPVIPTEVVERVIDNLWDDVSTLHNFSLTCRDLAPRSRYHILSKIRIVGQGQLNSVLNLLNANPDIPSLVR
ncbi:hypothetical protein DICSQDRAFT_51708 [Dichomitus squalens LYAD-421 SS1]|uniref:F-box domain-containing protein n=1 Tax=Dichomitus squalens TaxID=114155 RepID=A0A4Q9N4C5_9APHY|nr:uncharacterized protein DICSQDRAFT_51708 [Dichomitus squalens LYAD-421 SS1]EJF65507.1 hypothetical protein DICSQDRAFT_51708 [Dichomitus squalens LYAD-421 SS1]TBU33656.1 hypothetical protein BD311DRAFT_844768 [Dichomitus squalens]